MGHVQDLWFKTLTDPVTGRPGRVKTDRHGKGRRYRVRYLEPTGRERSRCFPDRHKRQAEDYLIEIEGDLRTGGYLDPTAGEVTFSVYAELWLASQTFEESTRETVALRLRRHITPHLGSHKLAGLSPAHIRAWDRQMQKLGLAASYRNGMFTHVRTILNAAVDDERIRKNPCNAASVKKPRVPARKVQPWSAQRVDAVHKALADRYKLTLRLGAGLGLRQGEALGLAPGDLDVPGSSVHVQRQIKLVGGTLCFGPPKGGKTRRVPLPESVLQALTRHTETYPPLTVTLPWQRPDGDPATTELLVYTRGRTAVCRQVFNQTTWRPALGRAGVTSAGRVDGFHALRHFYASTLLDAGESVTALAEYLGHTDPGFTLRTYTHLMRTSHERTRHAVDAAFHLDGTETA